MTPPGALTGLSPATLEPLPLAPIQWYALDTWIVVTGALAAMSCALLGAFLVLRRQSMMGDAISHAVLPGLAAAFLLTHSRDSVVMLLGAAVVGVLTAVFTEWIRAAGKVDEGASMGVVFTVLFAIGLILIRQSADHVDLDPDCVLYGAIELVTFDMTRVPLGPLGDLELPRAAMTAGLALLLNSAFVWLLFKELRIAAFDPALATTLGINARLMHYALMTFVAVTTVVAFESVGSILVIAMLIVPPAAAHLLTDRLSVMVWLSVLIAAASAVLGHVAALAAPGWFGYDGVSTNTAGMMAVVVGLTFLAALLLGPRHGLVSRAAHRVALSLRIVREDLLGLLFRLEEAGRGGDGTSRPALLRQVVTAGPILGRLALYSLARAGYTQRDAGGGCRLTPAGRAAARNLVRSHRLWETYLSDHIEAPADHLHGPAERLEHVTDAGLRERLADSLAGRERDPHGTPIPPRETRSD